MPKVKLRDGFGLAIDVEPNESSTFFRYFKNLIKLRFTELNAKDLANTNLDNLPVKAFAAGVSFEQPVELGTDQAELKIGLGARARIECLVPGAEQKSLFEADLYGDPIEIPSGSAYFSLGITANVATRASGKATALAFGVSFGNEVTLSHYRLFAASSTAFPAALEATLRDFVIPGDLSDLAVLPAGSICSVEGNGTLKFSGNASLVSIANPLYDASLPAGVGALSIGSGASITVGAAFELTGKYQIRIHKTSAATCRLGYYRNRGAEFGVKVAAKAGIAATIAEADLITSLMPVISGNPEADRKELEDAGLRKGQVQAMESAIKAGVERSIELAVGLELSEASSQSAAFLYEIDLAKLDAESTLAVQRALAGNLEDLTKAEDSLPSGITLVKSIFTALRQRKHTFKVNLLGIYNFVSVTALLRKGSVLFDAETGELTISDSATASRIRASMSNLATDTQKLRKLLAEQFLVTAVYRSSRLTTAPPTLKSSHSYFERHARTNQETMKDNLDAAEAMGLISADKKQGVLEGVDEFGRSLLLIDTSYDNELTRALFFKDGEPRSEDEYDAAGREALARLVQRGDPDDYRRVPAVDNLLWARMKDVGQPGFGVLFAGLTNLQLEVIRSDYTVIRWWSETMRRMAIELQKVDKFLAANPQAAPESAEFKALRKRLGKALESVARNVKEQFGDPWGLVAMDMVSGQRAEARFRLSTPSQSWNLSRLQRPEVDRFPAENQNIG